jgi:methylated-DNA-[protein]-cysteine S-methyltransferase
MKPPPAPEVLQLPIPTSEGEFCASYSSAGLRELRFPSPRGAAFSSRATNVPATIQRWHRQTTAAVKKILAGRAPGALPPLDLSAGTEFQRHVWNALRKICPGRTGSYGGIAALLGKPTASRAVGSACGANPIPLLLPCHRVLAANGKIGGFSGGREWKKRLLAREGVEWFR